MRIITCCVVLALVGAVSGGCGSRKESTAPPGPEVDAARPTDAAEAARFQGTWSFVAVEVAGKPADRPEEVAALKASTVVFDGDVIQTRFPKKSDKGRFALAPSRSPKEITVTWDPETQIRGQEVGVYAFDGVTLKIRFAAHGQPRPAAVEGGTAGGLWVLRREGGK